MCLIAIKSPSVAVEEPILRLAFENNPDGAGLGWRTDKGIEYRKGFMTFCALQSFIYKNREVLDKTEVVFHFRLASSGKITPLLTHPFCLDDIESVAGVTHRGVVFHNGHIDGFSDGVLSDTALMVKNYIMPVGDIIEYPGVLALLELAFENQKIAIMTPQHTHLLGSFCESKVYRGWRFSNLSYLRSHDRWSIRERFTWGFTDANDRENCNDDD